jgi:hypothetical protein
LYCTSEQRWQFLNGTVASRAGNLPTSFISSARWRMLSPHPRAISKTKPLSAGCSCIHPLGHLHPSSPVLHALRHSPVNQFEDGQCTLIWIHAYQEVIDGFKKSARQGPENSNIAKNRPVNRTKTIFATVCTGSFF